MRIRPTDESKLLWFFGEGQSLEAVSQTGVVLEKQSVLSVSSGKCRRCQGTGLTGGAAQGLFAYRGRDERDSACRRCGGSGRVMLQHSASGAASGCTTMACRKCRGATGRMDCPDCGGDGYLAVDRAAPTTPLPDVRQSQPPCSRLHSRFATLSRRIWRVGRTNARTLATFYGDPGQAWERNGGRMLSLYSLTEAGAEMLNVSDGSHAEFLRSLLELERLSPVRSRTRAISRADQQARAMYAAAAEGWCNASA